MTMKKLSRHMFNVSATVVAVGLVLSFAAVADAIPYFLVDPIGAYVAGACIAFVGAAGLGLSMPSSESNR